MVGTHINESKGKEEVMFWGYYPSASCAAHYDMSKRAIKDCVAFALLDSLLATPSLLTCIAMWSPYTTDISHPWTPARHGPFRSSFLQVGT